MLKTLKTILLSSVILSFICTLSLFAQTEKESVHKKLKNIKGAVEKIIIQTADGEVEFAGEEAEILMKNLKSKKMHKIITSGGDNMFFFDGDSADKKMSKKILRFGDEDVMFFGDDDGDHEMLFEIHESDENAEKKKIDVTVEDGVKKVTVTTSGNGEEKTETYEGEEADEYLEKMKRTKSLKMKAGPKVFMHNMDKHHKKLKWVDEDDVLILIGEDDIDGEEIEVEVEVNEENGEKTVTVKTTKDGDTNVETYTGEEAEKYLKEHKGHKGLMLKSEDGNVFKIKKLDKNIIWQDDDDEFDIEISDEDGENKIIKIKKITGADDEKILEWIDSGDKNSVSKKITMEVENGVKKLTVTTIKDGEETVETFEGDEADEYMKKLEEENDMKIKISEDGANKKVIIKKKSKEE